MMISPGKEASGGWFYPVWRIQSPCLLCILQDNAVVIPEESFRASANPSLLFYFGDPTEDPGLAALFQKEQPGFSFTSSNFISPSWPWRDRGNRNGNSCLLHEFRPPACWHGHGRAQHPGATIGSPIAFISPLDASVFPSVP